MKKRHRRAVCFTLNGIIAVILSPFILMAYLGILSEGLVNFCIKPCDWLKTKLRVYDYDPDQSDPERVQALSTGIRMYKIHELSE